jgi:hypothetical protein
VRILKKTNLSFSYKFLYFWQHKNKGGYKMKKIISMILIFLLVVVGCGKLARTPTNEVEDFFARYQTLDEQITGQLDDIIARENALNQAQREEYTKIMQRQYQNLTYDVKEETIDGNNAIVTVEVEVYDLNKTIQEAQQYLEENPDEFLGEDNVYSETLFFDYRIREMGAETERVKYTLNLSLTKQNGVWVMDELTETDREKIHGIYDY